MASNVTVSPCRAPIQREPTADDSADGPRLHFRITTVGAYTTRILLAYFVYADAVVVDTPIVDEQYRSLIHDVHNLSDRVNRSEYFRIYLDRQWAKAADQDLPWHWSRTSERLADHIRIKPVDRG